MTGLKSRIKSSKPSYRTFLALGALLFLSACGSGGGKKGLPPPIDTNIGSSSSSSSSSSGGSSVQAPKWTPGIYSSEKLYAERCVTPLSGINPFTERPYGHVLGTAMHEKMWIRSMSNDLYLWFNQLTDPDPAPFGITEYFDLLKTSSDRFHYATPVEEYFNSSESGVVLDYGIRWHFDTDGHPILRVADLDAAYNLENQLNRGDTLISVDGITLTDTNTNSEIDTIIAGLSPTTISPTHVFKLRDVNTTQIKNVRLTAQALEHNPVPRHSTFVQNGTIFGYLQFDDHNAISEDKLIGAINSFAQSNVEELILDIRYNTGGYLYVASELSYMIAGNAATKGKAFITPKYNSKHKFNDPISGQPIQPFPFLSDGGSGPTPAPLPVLNLQRIYVLTTDETCSASEAIINGLKGVGVEVVQIGSTTCGKPYAFQPQENCGTLYSTVIFSNENAVGFGDYADGFSPTNNVKTETQSVLPGCDGADDVDHALGAQEEGLLATAIYWQAHQSCPPASPKVSFGKQLKSKWIGSSMLWSAAAKNQPNWKANAYLDPKSRRE